MMVSLMLFLTSYQELDRPDLLPLPGPQQDHPFQLDQVRPSPSLAVVVFIIASWEAVMSMGLCRQCLL